MTLVRAPDLERVVDTFRALNPTFLWAPTSTDNLLRDRITGMRGVLSGSRPIQSGGLVQGVAPTNGIKFPTNLGIGADGQFMSAVLVSVRDPSALSGMFLKIGGESDGIGIGAGTTTADSSGGSVIGLREAVAWDYDSGTAQNAFVNGINLVWMAKSSDPLLQYLTYPKVAYTNLGTTPYNAPAAELHINGYTASGPTSRPSPATVHLVAIWARGNFQTEAARIRDYAWDRVAQLRGAPEKTLRDKSSSSRGRIFIASIGTTLSAATVTSITSTTAIPRVTLTFS